MAGNKKTVIGAVIVTVAVMIIALNMGAGNYLQNLGGGSYKAPSTVTTTTTVVNGVTAKYTGAVNFQVKGAITANGTAPTATTDYTVTYLQSDGKGGYTPLGSDTDGTEQMVIGKNDKVYALVKIASGKNFYIDPVATKAQQSDGTVTNVVYADPLTSGLASYMFELDMTVIKANADPNNIPTYEWYPRFYGYSAFKINSPSSQLSIGTGQVTKTILWQITADTQPSAIAIKAWQVKVNGTDSTNEVAESQSYIDIPDASAPNGVNRKYLSDMTQSVDYSTTSGTNDRTVGQSIFRYTYSQSTVNGADIVSVPTTGTNTVFVPVSITGTTSGAICVQLKYEAISARNAAITIVNNYDAVELVSGASNSQECTMGGST